MSAPHTPIGLYFTKEGQGEGLFDALMLATNKHLEQQFKIQSRNLTLAADVVDRPTEQSAQQVDFRTNFL